MFQRVTFKFSMILLFLLPISLASVVKSSVAWGSDTLKNIENQIQIDVQGSNISSTQDTPSVQVKLNLQFPADLKANQKAPWKFEWDSGETAELKEFLFSEGRVTLEKKLSTKNRPMNEEKNSPQNKTSHAWKLTYFVCDKEKKWCKRVVKEGQLSL